MTADSDPHDDTATSGRELHQGESTYAPEDMSEAARRSKWREVHDAAPIDPAPLPEPGPLLGGVDPNAEAAGRTDGEEQA